jgi:phage terminase large subunit-like protein
MRICVHWHRDGTKCGLCIGRPVGLSSGAFWHFHLLKKIIADSAMIVTRGSTFDLRPSTFDNASNLDPQFLRTVLRKYGGARFGRQELEAELLEDVEGSLWKRDLIEQLRIVENQLPSLNRIVVAIDPNASSAEDSNEYGIVCVDLGDSGNAYVLDDISGVLASHDWASKGSIM